MIPRHYLFDTFRGERVHLGVCGSVAAYKALELTRALVHLEMPVEVTLTTAATQFVTPMAFRAVGVAAVHTAPFHLEDPFQHRTILVIDQYSASAERYYGLKEAFAALPRAVMAVADAVPDVRVVVRLHPSQKHLGYWQVFRHRVELSQGVPLHQDLARTTVVVGLFSGALTVAAASGVPTFFVWEPGWFYTPDLRCFQKQFFSEKESREITKSCLQSEVYHRDLCIQMLEEAQHYYHGGAASEPETVVSEIRRTSRAGCLKSGA